ncbi:hypothetical protein [Rubinisphaera sp.]|mgnify:FL=1|uniref:hypothetical protein n=1 Tax=Rubinisphaera sp. TaxID=2024857 RepID=UPI000C0CCCE7|nr:hypothetical protein [Rubinisphaera sp.]MBV10544.1 hypothetical protein [Rubinisphaera sp.]HCS55137.1 hypothetical protein [Planctomycetaceae bacterium]
MSYKMISTYKLAPAFLIVMFSGCAAVNMSALTFWAADEPAETVSNIMGLWQPGEGRDPQGMPARGFAGQVFFFTHGNEAPVKVTGSVKVYVFDDQGTPEEQRKPIHIYEFDEGSWNAYCTKTNIGYAYQVFIPYPKPGDHRAVCSLRVKHTAKSAEVTLSDPADILLNGRTMPPLPKTVVTNETIVPEAVQSGSTMKVTTIPTSTKGKGQLANRTSNPEYPSPVPHSDMGIDEALYSQFDGNKTPEKSEFELTSWNVATPARKSAETSQQFSTPVPQETSRHPFAQQSLSTQVIEETASEAKTLFQDQHPFNNSWKRPEKQTSTLKVETILLQ